MTSFKGKNTTESSYVAYYNRAHYKNDVYEEGPLGPKMSKDFNFAEYHLYGVVDLDYNAIEPNEDLLVPLESKLATQGFHRVMPWCNAMLRDLKNILDKATFANCATNNPFINNLTVYRSYESPREIYAKHLKQTIQEFIDTALLSVDTNLGQHFPISSITHFESFVKQFINFCAFQKKKHPLTYSTWMVSKKSSIYNSGCGVALSNLKYSEDTPKWKEVISTPEFQYYKNVIKQIGFIFDFNNPMVVTPDYGSPSIQNYLAGYNTAGLQSLFNIYFNKCYNKDIDLLYNILKNKYNIFVNSNEYQIVFNEKCIKSSWYFFKRETITDIPIDDKLKYYLELKCLEWGIEGQNKKTLIFQTKNLEKILDKEAALSYINETTKRIMLNQPFGYKDLANKFKQTQQKKIGGSNAQSQTTGISSY